MRTFDEMVAFAKQKHDFFGSTSETIIGFLPYAHAQEFLKDDVTEAQWTPFPYTREKVTEEMRDYIDFAWEKANDERGLSAQRSIARFSAWLWLLGDDSTYHFLQDGNNYPMYGKPMLRKVCEVYGFPIQG